MDMNESEKQISVILFVCFVCLCHTHGIWKYLSQEMNLSYSHDPCLSYCNIRSFNLLYRAGGQTRTSIATRATAVRFLTTAPQWELQSFVR